MFEFFFGLPGGIVYGGKVWGLSEVGDKDGGTEDEPVSKE